MTNIGDFIHDQALNLAGTAILVAACYMGMKYTEAQYENGHIVPKYLQEHVERQRKSGPVNGARNPQLIVDSNNNNTKYVRR
tara:strand:+ start:1300 stop:1545 length:246 start_codon:yes stop_codon:yes gene_type:complete